MLLSVEKIHIVFGKSHILQGVSASTILKKGGVSGGDWKNDMDIEVSKPIYR